MERTYTEIGQEYTKGHEDKFDRIFANLEWQKLPVKNAPFGQGYGCREMIQQLKLQAPKSVAWSNELAPYGLLAVDNHFKNGMARIYAIDEGSSLTIVASDFFPNEPIA